MTVNELIKDSLGLVGAVAKSETPAADDVQDALRALNSMLALWSADGLMIMSTVLENFTLTAGDGTYTIGSGADFDTAKPIKIMNAYVRDSGGNDYPVAVREEGWWDAISQKTTEGRPEVLYYDPGLTQQATPTGTIYLHYEPDAAYTLYLRSFKKLTALSSISDELTMDSVYEEALKYNLAIRLYRAYHEHGTPIPVDIVEMAKATKMVVQKMNSKRIRIEFDLPGCRSGSYNILAGE